MAYNEAQTDWNAHPPENSDSTESKRSADGWDSWKMSPPPEGSQGVGAWVWSMMKYAHKYRESLGITEVWRHNHELFRNRYFKNPKPKITQVPVNFVFETINRLVANLTDNEPEASIAPRGDAGDDAARAWGAIYDEWWEDTRQQDVLTESVGNSELYGCQVDEMRINPELMSGTGEIETVLGDNFGIILWPGYLDLQKSPMIFKLESIELDTIYREFEKLEGKVKADTSFSGMLAEDRRDVRGNQSKNTIRPYLQAGYPQSTQAGIGSFKPVDKHGVMQQFEAQKALVVTCWVKDYTLEWVNPVTGKKSRSKPKDEELQYMAQEMQPAMDPITGQLAIDPQTGQAQMQPAQVQKQAEAYQQSKYPGYLRRIRVTNKGTLIMDDLPNPSINPMIPRDQACDSYLWDHFPFIKRLSYSDGISEYGLSIVEQIEPLVMQFSQLLTKVISHLKGACDPLLVVPKGSGVEDRDINNLPNRILKPNMTAAQLLHYLETPALPTDYAVALKMIMLLIDIVTGLSDVTEGRPAQGVQAAAGIAQLQEKAQSILRRKIRNLDTYLEEQGRMFISLGQNWYSFERKVKASGEDIQFRAVEQKFQGRFAFRVEAGSTLPQNKWALRQQALSLKTAGVVDPEYVLDAFNVGKKAEIMERMKQGPLIAASKKLESTGMFNSGVEVKLTPQFLQTIIQIIAMPKANFEKLFPQAKAESQTLANMMKAGLPEDFLSASAPKITKAAGPAMMAGIAQTTQQSQGGAGASPQPQQTP